MYPRLEHVIHFGASLTKEELLKEYAAAVKLKTGVDINVVGFIDGTVRPIMYYSDHDDQLAVDDNVKDTDFNHDDTDSDDSSDVYYDPDEDMSESDAVSHVTFLLQETWWKSRKLIFALSFFLFALSLSNCHPNPNS